MWHIVVVSTLGCRDNYLACLHVTQIILGRYFSSFNLVKTFVVLLGLLGSYLASRAKCWHSNVVPNYFFTKYGLCG